MTGRQPLQGVTWGDVIPPITSLLPPCGEKAEESQVEAGRPAQRLALLGQGATWRQGSRNERSGCVFPERASGRLPGGLGTRIRGREKSRRRGFLSGWGWCHFPKCGKSQSRGAQRLWSSGVLTRPGDERVGSTVCPRQGRCRWKAETGILVRVNAMQHVR